MQTLSTAILPRLTCLDAAVRGSAHGVNRLGWGKFWKQSKIIPEPLRVALRFSRLNLDGLSWDSECDVVGLNVLGHHCAGANHCVFSDVNSRKHRGVIGDPYGVADCGQLIGDFLNVIDVVAMGIDIGVIRYRNVVSYLDATPIIQKYVPVDHYVIAKREVVTIRPFDKVPALEVLAHSTKDQRRQHSPESMANERVLSQG